MMVIVGLVVLLAAVIVGTVGVLGNAGGTHPVAENFSVLGYHVTGSTGTLFLSGIVVGAVGVLGLSVLLAGARRSAIRGRDARRDLARSQRETAFVNRDRAQLLERQPATHTVATSDPTAASSAGEKVSLFGRWARRRQTIDHGHFDVAP
ncbi:hypothetical protein OK015_21745 [Mycobacterium sp. Aquia_216]|uniref:hypothetical protein n=1 Tax=Mycobacterium sp. Aquia_216 TaxID=2991729 RepID=UPI00227B538E|nr:hypothetical protein [Mycobacterium sp. Aquia_216]WAJ43775.1 hypothetical protein OK015_21745 [Mycobacterium sp. Aquia_216]